MVQLTGNMKKISCLFLLITQVFWAQNDFEKGNECYTKGDFTAAVASYEKVLNTKKESAELYFNLGNAYYKLNKVAPAIYNFEKALLLQPNDSEIKNNLKFAQKMQIDAIKEVPKVGFNKVIEDFTSYFHYDSWAWFAVGFATLFLLFFIGYYFSHTTLSKRIFFIAMFLALLLIVLSVLAALFEKSNYDNENPAIVFAAIVSVKSEPNKEATDAFVLHEGTKVYVLEALANWRKIELSDGTKGWIEKEAIQELK